MNIKEQLLRILKYDLGYYSSIAILIKITNIKINTVEYEIKYCKRKSNFIKRMIEETDYYNEDLIRYEGNLKYEILYFTECNGKEYNDKLLKIIEKDKKEID